MNAEARHEEALKILKAGTVIPATPLVLDENRKLDPEGQKLLMCYYLNCGVGGIATAVHTTQFEIRKPEYNMFEPVLKIVSETISQYEEETGKVIVKVAGVCGPVEQAVKEAEIAKKYGFDAVLLSPGGMNALTEDEMIYRTEQVAKVMPVIGFYLQQAVGGRVFTYNYWERVCAVDNVIAIKCASFNRYTTLDVVRAAALSKRADQITLYTGNDDNIVIDLLTKYSFTKDGKVYTKSFQGGLLGHWSAWCKSAVEIFNKTQAAKNSGAPISQEMLTLAAAVTDVNSAFFDTAHAFSGCIAGLHEILHREGLMKNIYCLNPNETLSEGQAEALTRVTEEYPELCDDSFIAANLESWKKEVAGWSKR